MIWNDEFQIMICNSLPSTPRLAQERSRKMVCSPSSGSLPPGPLNWIPSFKESSPARIWIIGHERCNWSRLHSNPSNQSLFTVVPWLFRFFKFTSRSGNMSTKQRFNGILSVRYDDEGVLTNRNRKTTLTIGALLFLYLNRKATRTAQELGIC